MTRPDTITAKAATTAFEQAMTLHRQQRLPEAAAIYQSLLQHFPHHSSLLFNYGVLFMQSGHPEKALPLLQSASTFSPTDVEIYAALGRAYQQTGQNERAIDSLQHATAIAPQHAGYHEHLAVLYENQHDLENAIYHSRLAYQNAPTPHHAETYFKRLQKACAWQEIDVLLARLREQPDVLHMPLTHVICCDDQAENLRLNQQLSQHFWQQAQKNPLGGHLLNQKDKSKTLHIGYLSCDFHDNATAHLMRSLFGLHDRNQFTVSTYSYGVDDQSQYRREIAESCDQFIDIRTLTDRQAAERIAQDQVDILVDLKGYTAGHRMAICAYRPAPIIVTYLGYPGTSGATFIDYVVADRIVLPETQQPYYTENIVYLPHSYQVNDQTQPIADTPYTRKACGLPEVGFIFGAFNQPYKIEPVMFGVWMQLLQSVPGSVLWCFAEETLAITNLQHAAAGQGVNPARLIFAGRVPKPEHLARLQLVDLALDTRICGGHTTTSDALWAGVPVLTLQGRHFASRVSASLLTAIGLPELITHSLEEYKEHARTLATNPQALIALKRRLAENRLTMPLFDTPRFVHNLECAYTAMWERYCDGKLRTVISIEEDTHL
ncbi:MAG: tetratricopeptide repeat protein [Hyphomicrobiales bacterium]|nr:tetratricopeptide repeat protein [Hyphomicrobiales bacterium]